MVEPVDYVFERLQDNYGQLDRVHLERVAIAETDGVRPFYHLVDASSEERERLPDWYDGVGSFSKGTVLGHRKDMPDVAARLVETPVQTVTFDSLCRRHDVQQVDLIVIDTEGYDWEILRSIDLARWAPALVVYEHFHLTAIDRAAARDDLTGLGYQIMEEGFDTFALGPRAPAELRTVWDRLRPAVRGVSVEDEGAVND
jgi:FkbM family methyltransferase